MASPSDFDACPPKLSEGGADFKIKAGDILILQEWNPKTKKYTGRELRKKANLFSIATSNNT
ncbi:MAG: hypothetical protein NT116_05095 [Candidatus Parcubacteria bacterium]|nr:hypothetical protein [Candidatus Parcubacteria bacterium]